MKRIGVIIAVFLICMLTAGGSAEDTPVITWTDYSEPTAAVESAGRPVMRSDRLTEEQKSEYYYEPCVLGNAAIKRGEIRAIEFCDSLENAVSDAWDISRAGDGSVMAWTVDDEKGKKLFIAGQGGITAPKDSSYLFARYDHLEEINFNNCFFTDNTVDMSFLFNRCESLKSVDVSSFDTGSAKTMQGMFYGCIALTSLDVTGFNTSNVRNMQSIFRGCTDLDTIDVSGFDTSDVRSMKYMFYNCSGLTSLDVSGFDTGEARDLSCMFYGCGNLERLDVSHFDTSNAVDFSSMFYGCSSLERIDVRGFKTGNVMDMNSMFSGCTSLAGLDVSKFDTANVINMQNMFYHCDSLETIELESFDTHNVKSMSHMFAYCGKVTALKVDGFDTGSVKTMKDMFYQCDALKAVDVSGFDTGNVTDMSRMFGRCGGLTRIDLSAFSTGNVKNASKMFASCGKLTELEVSDRFILLKREKLEAEEMFDGCPEELEMLRDGSSLSSGEWLKQATITPGMKYGDKSDSVMWLQRVLAKLGYLSSEADGSFGQETDKALTNYQMDHLDSGLYPNGVADEGTIKMLCASM